MDEAVWRETPLFGGGSVTIEDVARRAGVSKKTVSRVINGEEYVAEATAARVREIIEATGYVPNVSARRLASRRSHVLTLVYQAEEPPGWLAQVIQGIVRTAATAGFELVIHPCAADEDQSRQSLRDLVLRGGTDGLILLPPFGNRSEFNLALHQRGLPLASIEPSDPNLPWSAASITNFDGAREMTTYLIGLGHRRIGFVVGAADYRGSWERLEGYQAALAEAGIPLEAGLIRQGEYTFESGLVQGGALLQLADRPTAIFASNDEMAAGVIQAACGAGLRVPADLSVAGFDDSILACRLSPPLTTIRQPTVELASRVTEALIARIQGGEAPAGRLEMATSLVVRGSTEGPWDGGN